MIYRSPGERGSRSCPNGFQRAHQPWLNTCYGARTKRANPICISDILNIVQSPGITRSFSARWNSKTYFSNLWTDDKSKLSHGQWNIHQRAENRLEKQRQAHRCGVCSRVWNIRHAQAKFCPCHAEITQHYATVVTALKKIIITKTLAFYPLHLKR